MKAVYRAEPLPDQLPANKRPNIILFLTDDQARNANVIRSTVKLTGLNPYALDDSFVFLFYCSMGQTQSGDLLLSHCVRPHLCSY